MSLSCAGFLKDVVNQLKTFSPTGVEQSAAQYYYEDGKSIRLFYSNDSV